MVGQGLEGSGFTKILIQCGSRRILIRKQQIARRIRDLADIIGPVDTVIRILVFRFSDAVVILIALVRGSASVVDEAVEAAVAFAAIFKGTERQAGCSVQIPVELLVTYRLISYIHADMGLFIQSG